MPSFFPRYLLFPTSPTSPTSPMWDRPSTGSPIFATTRASRPDSMMWSRPGAGVPIYEEPVTTSAKSQMWRRSGIAAVPMCPCCTEGTVHHHASSRQGSMDTTISEEEGSTTTTTAPTSPRHSGQSARRPSVSSGLGLRLRKSFASLRSRASRSTMRE